MMKRRGFFGALAGLFGIGAARAGNRESRSGPLLKIESCTVWRDASTCVPEITAGKDRSDVVLIKGTVLVEQWYYDQPSPQRGGGVSVGVYWRDGVWTTDIDADPRGAGVGVLYWHYLSVTHWAPLPDGPSATKEQLRQAVSRASAHFPNPRANHPNAVKCK
jgi:hypothetical protein